MSIKMRKKLKRGLFNLLVFLAILVLLACVIVSYIE